MIADGSADVDARFLDVRSTRSRRSATVGSIIVRPSFCR